MVEVTSGTSELGLGLAGGVPGMMLSQEPALYTLSHHTPLDTLDRAVEANLVQGAQVMAVAAMRIANLDSLLPRQRVGGRRP